MSPEYESDKYLSNSESKYIFSSKNNKYSTVVTFVDKTVIHLDVIGSVNERTLQEVWTQVEQVIIEKTNGENYILIHNYKDIKSATLQARNDYIHWVNNNIEHIDEIYFYNVSPYFRVIIQAGKLISSKLSKTYIFNSLDEILASIYDKSSLKDALKEIDFWNVGYQFSSFSGETYTTRQKWIAQEENGESHYETYLVNQNIFIRRFVGKMDDNSMKTIAISFDNILEELNLKHSEYHLFIDFSKVESMTLGFRKDGLTWFLNHKDNLITSGFFNLSTVLKMQLKIARSLFPFTHFVKQVFILDTLSDVFQNIESPN